MPPSAPVSEEASPLHTAVANRDVEQIAQLRKEGSRANQLDEQRRSPLDVLDTMRDIDERSRSGLRMALLQSLNPTAPVGHMKPEALHGTPWGLEIIRSGALKGGVNDAKGGNQSLEGRVFFSDRTAESPTEKTTRSNLRVKARLYAKGDGLNTSNASSRAQQHRLTQVMLRALENGKPLPANEMNPTLTIVDPEHAHQEAAAWLQRFLHASYIMKGTSKQFTQAPLDQHTSALTMPASITLKTGEQITKLEGDDLAQFYRQAAGNLRHDLENGKAPYLSLLNQGVIVPVVFGFEKINNLSTHTIRSGLRNIPKDYSYQSNDHPLAGSAQGGKVKEIEVRNLQDLATLCLGCAAQGVELPHNIAVRIKTHKKDKAEYLDTEKIVRFRDGVLAHAAQQIDDGPLADQDLEHLQQINASLRDVDLGALYK
jgi:hypothetical protein